MINRSQKRSLCAALVGATLLMSGGMLGLVILAGGGIAQTFRTTYLAVLVAAAGAAGGIATLMLLVDRQYVRDGIAEIEDAVNGPQEPVDADVDEDGDL